MEQDKSVLTKAVTDKLSGYLNMSLTKWQTQQPSTIFSKKSLLTCVKSVATVTNSY